MNPILMTLGSSIDSTFSSFDMWVFHFFGSMQNTFLTYVAKFFTTLGDEAFVIPLIILAVVLCFFKKTRKYGFTLMFAIVIGTLVTNVVVKPMALRIRPYNTLQGNADYWKWYIGAGALSESDYSFPSGHTTAAFEVMIAMFLCVRSEGKKKLAWIFPLIAICVAGSRVYLMVHYATDVIGGFVVGTLSAIIAYFLAKLAVMIFEKTPLDKIDAEKIFKNGISKKVAMPIITIAVLGIFLYAFIPSLTEGGDVQRCAYTDGNFSCYNEAKVDDEKYPAIDGKNYCKIHYKQLTGETK